jgi:hypothetical protein
MSVVRVAAILAIAAIISPGIMQGALAQDYQAQTNRTIDLATDPTFPSNQDINLADIGASNTTAPDLEKDFLNPQFMQVGRYVGPYLHTSKFRFTYDQGGLFNFSVTYNFTPQQIMSGASEFWTRWPIDVSDYDAYCISIGGIFAPNPLSTGNYVRCNGDPFHDFEMPTQLRVGDSVVTDSTGLYIKEWNGLLSNHDYTFNFTGHMAQDATPSVWLTIEHYQKEANTTYTFSDYLKGSRHTENLPLYPAFAFNFIQGIGEGGLTSYEIPFDGSTSDFIVFPGAYGTGTLFTSSIADCSKYISFYIPYYNADNVTWYINMTWEDLRAPPYPSVNTTHFQANTTRDFLLVSSYGTVDQLTNGYCTLTSGAAPAFWIYVRPSKPVTLLGTVAPTNSQVWYLSLGDQAKWGYDIINYNNLFATGQDWGWFASWTPAFVDMELTSGRWAQVTPGEYFPTYDFGWGRAYLFPGSVRLTMFLNNGTAIGYDSILTPAQSGNRCNGLFQNVTGAFQPIADWINQLACFIYGLIGNVIGFIQTVFGAIWNAIKAIGEWIYNALVNFIKLIVSIATALVDVVVQIVFSLLYATPFILILFISAKAMPEVGDLIEKKVKAAYRRSTYARLVRRGKSRVPRRRKGE